MSDIYRTSRATHAASTTADSVTVNLPAGYRVRITYLEVTGAASALAAGQEMGLFRVTTVGSGGTPTDLTLKHIDPTGPNPPSGMSAVFGYTTQPVIESVPMLRLSFQPAGGKAIYQPTPGAEVIFGSRTAASQFSLRGIAGTGNVVVDAIEFEVL